MEDDALTLAEPGCGDLASEAEFGAFMLEFAWKVAPGGNSGVLYWVDEGAGRAWESGPEYQLLDDAGHADAAVPARRAGALYDLAAPADAVVRRAGEWNDARIVAGARIEHWLNGRRVVDVALGGEDWRARLARSKFAALPGFARVARGRIVLQDHGDRVWFRGLRVRAL